MTEDEAIVLLELCLYSKDEDDPIRASLLSKIGEFCKGFLREDQSSTESQVEVRTANGSVIIQSHIKSLS